MKKKIISILVTCIMVMSLLPIHSFADVADGEQGHNHAEWYCSICKEGTMPEVIPDEESGEQLFLVDGASAFSSLNNAIENAGDNSVIDVLTDINLDSKVTIQNKNIKIRGDFTLTRAFNTDAMFEIGENATVTFENLTIDGVGQYNPGFSCFNIIEGGKITLNNVKIKNSVADFGAAVYVGKDSTLVFENGTISECTALASGGAIYNEGNVEIDDGIFANNVSSYGAVVENLGNLYIYGGSYRENNATMNGGVINSRNSIYLSGSPDFSSNTVNGLNNTVALDNASILTLNGALSTPVGITINDAAAGAMFGYLGDGADGASMFFSESDESLYGSMQDGTLVWATDAVEESEEEPIEEPIEEPVEESIAEPIEEPIEEPVEEPVIDENNIEAQRGSDGADNADAVVSPDYPPEDIYYIVAFDVNGPGSSPKPQDIKAGDYAQQPVPTSNREGLSFIGWYLDKEGIVPFNFDEPINSDVQLYGKWEDESAEELTEEELVSTFSVNDIGNPDGGDSEIDQIKAIQQKLIDLGYLDGEADGSFGPASIAAMRAFQEAKGLPVTDTLDDATITAIMMEGEEPEVVKYSVTFDANGHEVAIPEGQFVIEGDYAFQPEDLSDEGYDFEGWFDNQACEGEAFDFENTPITTDIILYAKWAEQIVSHTVSYSAEQFTAGIPEAETVDDGMYATRPETIPTADDYQFGGWYDNAECEGETFAFEDTPITSDITLYAKALGIYQLVFDTNGHGEPIEPQTVIEGDLPLRPINPGDPDYSFDGWYYDADCQVPFDWSAPMQTTTTIYAKWVANAHTVTFEANGYGLAPQSQKVEDGQMAKDPGPMSYEGMEFTGWYSEKECKSIFNFAATPIKSDITVYAGWRIPVPETFTVTYNMNNHGVPIAAEKVQKGAYAKRPADPTASGFIFGGWFIDATLSSEFSFETTPITADLMLYAKWTEMIIPDIPCTVKFDLQGHGQQISEQKVEMNGRAIQPATPSETGYLFGGWFIDKECTKVFDFGSTLSSDTILYAKWTPIKYQVVLNSNGGTGSMSPLVCAYGEKSVLPANTFARAGYSFTGWNTNPAGSGSVYADKSEILNLSTTNNGIITLYAQWKSMYEVVEGQDSFYTIGSLSPLVFRVNGDFNKFTGVKIDGMLIDRANYDVWSGNGTYVSLKVTYLDTLPTGQHKITFMFTDSEVESQFTVTTVSNVKTGDPNDMIMWIAIGGGAVLAGALACIFLARKKKRDNR